MKPPLVFLPGWGQSAQVWYQQSTYFAKEWPVHTLNLPGHSDAPDILPEHWMDALGDALPEEPCILVGWSLGGMLAMALACARPEQLVGLVLVSSTPCFRVREDWKYGCSDEQFYTFEQALESDANQLLGQFFKLMLHGDALPRSRFNTIARAAVDRRHPPLPGALRSGLTLLDNLDLRAQLALVVTPTLVLHGAHDTIVPLAAGRYLSEHIPRADWHIMDCGHAPHLTQADAFNAYLEQWCLNLLDI